MRQNLIVGNWKMNGDRVGAAALCADIRVGIEDTAGDGAPEVVLCPPHILIPPVVAALTGSPLGVGAQDVDSHDHGAFTGQVSAAMVADSGCSHTLIGHSERRAIYGEADREVADKVAAAHAAGLVPILCLGETAAERERGVTEEVVGRQLDTVLDAVGVAPFAGGVVAYEPVWAIGSGASATPQQAQAVHHFLRTRLAARDAATAAACRLLYGGSVKPDNAAALMQQADIDGALVGGAALNAADFLAICAAAT